MSIVRSQIPPGISILGKEYVAKYLLLRILRDEWNYLPHWKSKGFAVAVGQFLQVWANMDVCNPFSLVSHLHVEENQDLLWDFHVMLQPDKDFRGQKIPPVSIPVVPLIHAFVGYMSMHNEKSFRNLCVACDVPLIIIKKIGI